MIRVNLGEDLSAETLAAIARGEEVKLIFGRDAQQRVKKARATVDAIVKKGAPVYGVNTGFGALAKEQISPEDTGTLQKNLLLSHAVGVGEDLPANVKRLALILRIHSLCRGVSGVRPKVVRWFMDLIHSGWLPRVPEQGRDRKSVV